MRCMMRLLHIFLRTSINPIGLELFKPDCDKSFTSRCKYLTFQYAGMYRCSHIFKHIRYKYSKRESGASFKIPYERPVMPPAELPRALLIIRWNSPNVNGSSSACRTFSLTLARCCRFSSVMQKAELIILITSSGTFDSLKIS